MSPNTRRLRRKMRRVMQTSLFAGAITFLLLAGLSCAGPDRSYCDSQCARCGRSCHTEHRGDTRVKMVIQENDLSEWLLQYDPTLVDCEHDWIPVSGWSSVNNLSWDGVSLCDGVLRQIKQIASAADDEVMAAGLLGRYYSIQSMDNDAEKGRQLEELHQDLSVTLEEMGGSAISP